MLQEFVIISFASFIGWEIFRYFAFFNINIRIAPIIVLCISYAMTFLSRPSILIAFAATGGVVLLHKITDATSPPPLSFPKPNFGISRRNPLNERSRKLNKGTKVKQTDSRIGHRIPGL